jgi:hypothetical protein
MFEEENMKCYFHPENDGLEVCNNCGKAICKDCINTSNGKSYCPACYPLLSSTSTSVNKARKNTINTFFPFLLIFIGLFLLAYNFRSLPIFWEYFWPIVMTILGLYFLIDWIFNQTKKSIIAGISMSLIGVYLLISYLEILPDYIKGWPTFWGVAGLVILIYYFLSEIKSYLLAGISFIILGILLFLNNMNILNFSYVIKFWPVIFVIIGIKLFYDFYKRR